ncbi:serine/threonine-protein kinase [Lentzea sp. BCCO 10_0856]|uniref:non-specific serine/threonine protein kinase n=1 Tax=Lentzea miocenica TaxID=3095431 RepID=A0ABU4T2L7_9PSEU|nr:serine/threonine-protein kinase [Lentzea sp. BCCO 10_0856]MDX8032400.1 serine/threonine-protein kinase [Lentzea sp. BCCO 10_0856]
MTDDGRLVAGRYRLSQRIGSGAMGVVWTAHDERLHRTVAVKQLLLQPGLAEADTDEAKRRAMREGRIAARLQHPHAVAVYDVAEDDSQPWLIMEYLPSKSLSAVLSERGTLPPRDVASIGMQVASALAAAHNAGIVHRDIKPGNVLLGDDGTVKITDFGISRATGDVTVTATGMLAGTPAYLAPEVAKGYDPGSPSDVFSLGSTLYAAIEGEPPFGLSENTIALLHKVASGKVNPPRNAGPLTALLMRLLRAEPEDRPTMAEARDALAAVANGQAAPAFTPAVVAPTHPPSWRGAPIQQPQQQAATRALPPQQAPPPNATRVDLYTPPRAVASQHQPPSNHRPAAAPQYSQRPKPASMASSSSSKSKKSTIYTALAIVAAAVIGIMFASMISDKNGNGGNNNAGANTSTPQTQNSGQTKQSTPPKSAGKAGQWTSQPTPDDMRGFLNEYFSTAPTAPDDAWKFGNANFQGSYPGGVSGFQGFWSGIKEAKVLDASEKEGFYWEVVVEYTKKNGDKTTERRGISFEWKSPNFLLHSDKSLGLA